MSVTTSWTHDAPVHSATPPAEKREHKFIKYREHKTKDQYSCTKDVQSMTIQICCYSDLSSRVIFNKPRIIYGFV